MSKTIFIVLLGAAAFLNSCIKYIDMKIPDHGRKPALNCLFHDSEYFSVTLHKSLFILDDSDFNPVENAVIAVTELNSQMAVTGSDTLYETSQGVYKSSTLLPKQGYTYMISSEIDNITVSSFNTVPYNVPVNKIDTSSIYGEYENLFRFTVEFTDPAGTDNYYMFEIQKESYGNLQSISISSIDPSVQSFRYNSLLFDDKLFSGKTKSFNLDISQGEIFDYSSIDSTLYIISLYSLSYDYYYYALTSGAQEMTGNSPFSEPVIVHNNITNGYGVFGGASVYRENVYVKTAGFP